MKKTDGWMPLYVADYLADTSRLTTEQHGAYLLLIMDYWRNGPPDADDEEGIASITKLSVAQWRKHAPKIMRLFHVREGRLWHKRIEEEREKAGEISSKRRDAGKEGAAKRWGKSGASGIANAMANGMANASQTPRQNDAPSPLTKTKEENKGANGGSLSSPALDLSDVVPDSGIEPTPGDACKAMRAQGLATTNPSNPRLLALLQAGITLGELEDAAADAVAKSKSFAYALGTAEGRRRDAAVVTPLPPRQQQRAAAEPAWRAEERARILQAVPGIAARPAASNPTTIDVEARYVPPAALG